MTFADPETRARIAALEREAQADRPRPARTVFDLVTARRTPRTSGETMDDDTIITAEEVRVLREAATPGPWWAMADPHGEVHSAAGFVVGDHNAADAALCATAPRLARTVERLHAELAAIQALSNAPKPTALETVRDLLTESERLLDLAVAAQVEAGERADRLARVLAVERGDESAAPDRWSRDLVGDWTYAHSVADLEVERRDGEWALFVGGVFRAVFSFALEAMEAVDAARVSE